MHATHDISEIHFGEVLRQVDSVQSGREGVEWGITEMGLLEKTCKTPCQLRNVTLVLRNKLWNAIRHQMYIFVGRKTNIFLNKSLKQ